MPSRSTIMNVVWALAAVAIVARVPQARQLILNQ